MVRLGSCMTKNEKKSGDKTDLHNQQGFLIRICMALPSNNRNPALRLHKR